jgi:hypothetical protein
MARYRTVAWRSFGMGVALLCVPLAALAAKTPRLKSSAEAVELFSAIESKQIEVQLIPKDSTECRLLITNKTGKPLPVLLPDVFAGVPVLAQMAPPGHRDKTPQRIGVGNNVFPNVAQNPQGRQDLNGLLDVANVGNNRQRRPFRAFTVAPEKVGQVRLPAVCLDPANPSPRAAIPYQIKPLASVADKPGVAEICAALGRGEVKQTVAQLAVWHVNNGISWEKLAKASRKHVLLAKPTYSADEIEAGRKLAEKATKPAAATVTRP